LSAGRLPALDGLRAISIMLVLGCHMLPLGPKVLQLNESAGAMGMSLFFGLSGFLITSTLLENPNVTEFLIRRLTRIVPLAYAYTFIVFGVLFYDPKTILWMVSFLLNYRGELNAYNAHFWSLCVEVHFYLSIALVVLLLGRKAIWAVWPICIAVTAFRIHTGPAAYYSIYDQLRMDELLAGGCLATLYQKSWSDRAPVSVILVGLAALLWFASSSAFSGWFQFFRPYMTALLMAAVLAHANSFIARFLASRPMAYIATISYALYVIHPLTIQGWMNTGGVFDRYLLKRPISFALTFGAAHLSTFYWEKLWIRAGKLWIDNLRKRRQRLQSV
jgi:peptidoglycan/LPS O-acetylase OafA/YrhL